MVTGTLKMLSGLGLKHAKKVDKVCFVVCQILKKKSRKKNYKLCHKWEEGRWQAKMDGGHTFKVFFCFVMEAFPKLWGVCVSVCVCRCGSPAYRLTGYLWFKRVSLIWHTSRCFEFFPVSMIFCVLICLWVFGSLQSSLLCKIRELEGGGAKAVDVSDMWTVTVDRWHMTCDTWHMTRDTWHLTHGTSFVWSFKNRHGKKIFQLPSKELSLRPTLSYSCDVCLSVSCPLFM